MSQLPRMLSADAALTGCACRTAPSPSSCSSRTPTCARVRRGSRPPAPSGWLCWTRWGWHATKWRTWCVLWNFHCGKGLGWVAFQAGCLASGLSVIMRMAGWLDSSGDGCVFERTGSCRAVLRTWLGLVAAGCVLGSELLPCTSCTQAFMRACSVSSFSLHSKSLCPD